MSLLATPPLAAQDFQSILDQAVLSNGVPPVSPELFGGGIETTIIPVQEFATIVGATPYSSLAQGYLSATSAADVTFWAPLRVPVGASVEQVCMEAFDNDNAEALTFLLVGAEAGSAGNPTPAGVALAGVTTGVAPVPGFVTLCAAPIGTFSFPLSVRTVGNINGTGTDTTIHYYLLIAVPATSVANAVTVGPAIVNWRRVVSPAPATATFSDVPTTHAFFRFIEAFSRAGITGGCGSGLYCPDNPVTRGEMATFLAVAMGLHFPN
jgi:hypothetical protein